MVDVLLRALLAGQVRQVAVVGVVGQIGDAVGADLVEDAAGDGGLAGGGAAGDAEHDGLRTHGGNLAEIGGTAKRTESISAGRRGKPNSRRSFWQ